MGIKTFPHPPYSTDLAPCDFWLFFKLTGCRYETIEMKEAVKKVIDTLTQEDFHEFFQKLLEGYNKCIAAGGDYFEGDKSFMCELSIKVPIRKSLENYCIHLVYIVIHRQTVSLYNNSSVWLDTKDASSWDWNPPNFTLDWVSYCSAISRHTSAREL